MFKIFSQRREAKEEKRKPLAERDFNIVKDGLDEEQLDDFVNDLVKQHGVSPSASLRSILKTVISSADEIVKSIKMKARAEAEEEAARIIAQAKQEAEEIKERSKTVVEKKVEDIVSVVEKVVEEKVEEPAHVQEDKAVSEPVMATMEASSEQHSQEKKQGSEENEPSLSKQEKQALYGGQVELAIGVPVNPNMVAKLYHYLQTTPEIKFVRTSGSWNRGTSITVMLDKPIPLISVISSRIPEAQVTPERPEKDGFVGERKGVRRINLALKEG